jgi:hypothetical protein
MILALENKKAKILDCTGNVYIYANHLLSAGRRISLL